MKKLKQNLRTDSVISDSFHVGIELELKAPNPDGSEHDWESCSDSQRNYLACDLGATGILREYFGVSRSVAQDLESYFNVDSWIDNYMEGWECEGDCGHYIGSNGDSVRNEIRNDLKRLTGNESVKVVSDGSINVDESCETDAEVCWNYFASKDTVKDNEKILTYLKNFNCDFDRSCGLHINLNNYLSIPEFRIETIKLDFLFDFVANSRRQNNFCNRWGMSHTEKYSMIYHQGDRLEFRFFSPTLDAEKLNMYVHLANVVYRRLAGQNTKLSKRAMTYFLDKMQNVNGLTFERAAHAIKQVNSLKSVSEFIASQAEKSLDLESA